MSRTHAPTMSSGEGGGELVRTLEQCRSEYSQSRRGSEETGSKAEGNRGGELEVKAARYPSPARPRAMLAGSRAWAEHIMLMSGEEAVWPKQCPEPMLYLLGLRVGGARQEVTRLVWGAQGSGCRRETQRGKRRERHRHGLSKQLKYTATGLLSEELVFQETASGSIHSSASKVYPTWSTKTSPYWMDPLRCHRPSDPSSHPGVF